eukprot:CAMPEP_0177663684 /NCGR_PEP_ID=MMETSP0447-20121125/20057_1 /TAXON_ID=0 /ORGANISM="Stygamoeba regulata, Strain BSH-02190019" /LENGTH=153 /DNA_ID=CAMNT_0019169537 /DNA_START=42 /DNA_END=503 /DNA_ORIENTATION=-
MSQFTDTQIRELKEAFCLFDTDHDGRISTGDLATVMRSVGKCPSEQQVRDIIAEFFSEGDGTLDFAEFVNMMAAQVGKCNQTEETIRNAFALFDKSKTGYVSVQEMRHVLTVLGEALNQEEVERMIREADPEETGRINYNEYAKVLAPDCRAG